MLHTYTQIHIQVVFAVEGRQNLIQPMFREELRKYISGIVRKREQKLLAIYCMPDHAHLLIGLRPEMALAELVHAIKDGSTDFVNRQRWFLGRFGWQEGFGAFSYGHSQIDTVVRYIRNQPRHHVRTDFRTEYLRFLKRFEIPHDERLVFGRPGGDSHPDRGYIFSHQDARSFGNGNR